MVICFYKEIMVIIFSRQTLMYHDQNLVVFLFYYYFMGQVAILIRLVVPVTFKGIPAVNTI